MAGMGTLGYAMKSWLDLSWYRTKSENITSVEDFEKTALAGFRTSHGVSTPVLSPSFSHLFGGGYESCYYSYQWAQVMEADVFSMFEKKGLYNRQLCAAFKRALEKGGSVEPGPLFRSIRHRAPRQANFLERQGLKKIFDYSAALAAPEPANDNASKAQPASVKNHAARAPKHSL
jgi:peptidyl-dipeptidase Dcp